ncbi:hypothetical protein EZS27_014758, partial [termite gut metagenome]
VSIHVKHYPLFNLLQASAQAKVIKYSEINVESGELKLRVIPRPLYLHVPVL